MHINVRNMHQWQFGFNHLHRELLISYKTNRNSTASAKQIVRKV